MLHWPSTVSHRHPRRVVLARGREPRASRVLPALVTSLLLALTASSQDAATGVVVGRATDPSGAPLAGARVKATRVATASARETTTDSAGRFVLASLAPGEYRVSIEASGFAVEDVRPRGGRGGPSRAGGRGSRRRGACRGGDGRGARGAPGHGKLARGRCRLVGGRREPPPERPQLPGAGLPASGERPGAQFRPDQVEHPGPLVRRPAGPRGEHHDRRTGQQRRRRRRSPRQPAAGRGPGVPDRHEPLLGRAGPLGGVGRERGDPQRQRHVLGNGHLPLPRRRPAGAAGHLRPQLGRGPAVLPGAVLGDARRADRAGQGLVVRGRGVPQPGRGRPGRRARHRDPHDPQSPGPGAARRLPRPGAGRRQGVGQRHPQPALRDGGPGRRRGQHARPVDRLLLAAPGGRQPAPPGPRDLDAHARPGVRQHAARELQPLSQLDRARRAGAPAHLPEHPGRVQLPRAPGHDAEALAGERLVLLGEGRPHAALRRRGGAHLRAASTSASSGTGASSWCRTSRSST